jgi:hypothetical protein
VRRRWREGCACKLRDRGRSQEHLVTGGTGLQGSGAADEEWRNRHADG